MSLYIIFQEEPEKLLCSNGNLVIKEIKPEAVKEYLNKNNLVKYTLIEGKILNSLENGSPNNKERYS